MQVCEKNDDVVSIMAREGGNVSKCASNDKPYLSYKNFRMKCFRHIKRSYEKYYFSL